MILKAITKDKKQFNTINICVANSIPACSVASLSPLPFLQGVLQAYDHAVKKRPVLTKALTSFVGFALGDRIAQGFIPGAYDPFRSVLLLGAAAGTAARAALLAVVLLLLLLLELLELRCAAVLGGAASVAICCHCFSGASAHDTHAAQPQFMTVPCGCRSMAC